MGSQANDEPYFDITQIPDTQETIDLSISQKQNEKLTINIPSSDSEEEGSICDEDINIANVPNTTTMSNPIFTETIDSNEYFAYTADE